MITNCNIEDVMLQQLKKLLFFIAITICIADDPEGLLSQGKTQLEAGEIQNAETSFNAALAIDQSFAPALQALSKLNLHKGDLTKANDYSNKAVKIGGEDFRDWANQIADIVQNMPRANKLGKSSEAIPIYNSIIENHPYYSDAYFYLGYNYYKNNDMRTASINFSKVLEIYPNHKNARTMFGNITKSILIAGNKAYKRGDLDGARTNYLKAIEYDPKYFKPYYQLGVLEKTSGNSNQAEKYLLKAIELDSISYKSWFILGAVYELDNKNDKAIECYKKAITIKYDYEKAYGNLGKLLYQVNQNYEEAESVLKEVTQIAPDYANGFFHLGMVYKIQGIALKNDLDASGTEDKSAYSSMKKILFKAIDNLDNSVQLDNSNYDRYNHLAELCIAVEDWDKAIECSQKSIDLKERPQSNGSAYFNWGMAVLKKSKNRNKNRALALFEKAKKDRSWRKAAEFQIVELKKEK